MENKYLDKSQHGKFSIHLINIFHLKIYIKKNP